jgi:hypothetical protein
MSFGIAFAPLGEKVLYLLNRKIEAFRVDVEEHWDAAFVQNAVRRCYEAKRGRDYFVFRTDSHCPDA